MVFSQVLFVVVSDSVFYKTRVQWIMDTWGQDVAAEVVNPQVVNRVQPQWDLVQRELNPMHPFFHGH